ncbi:hypothetical protein HMN09_00759000 [Mycena chlorophos]|uniref:Peroxisomal targeting signal receptor n=1 Tax=Mycena chlorophos TaxID=658473 RepID=A0A8H6SUC9_MYCCL|nr:hypothetical protein HMN09_00759000 [Mycena chlorophos]
MALPLLMNGGADCGPSNPLQGLSKRFDQDRGIQQDHFAPNRAGSSREAFRTAQSAQADAVQEAARFFGPQAAPQLAASNAFDLSAFHGTLPQAPAQTPQKLHHAPAAWASDFMLLQQSQQSPGTIQREMSPAQAVQGQPQWASRFQTFATPPQASMQMFTGMHPGAAMGMQQHQPQTAATTQHDQVLWDREFSAQETGWLGHWTEAQQQQPQTHEAETKQQQNPVQDADELARTAAVLLETVRDVENPKFKNSEFMQLMRGLRDREVVVEGNDMVKNTGQAQPVVDVKGKGRAVDPVPVMDPSSSMGFMRHFEGMALPLQTQPQQQQQQDATMAEEDPNDAYFRQENREYQQYWADAEVAQAKAHAKQQQQQNADWGRMQDDWDGFEATETGIKPVERYHFQANNPYLSSVGSSSTTRHHLAHAGREAFFESVLELEAVVQRNMTDASAWYDLGVKQQANEREQQALTALRRAVELDPTHLPSWLAIAVSHTNNGDRAETADAIRQWVDRNERYREAVVQFRASHPERADAMVPERYGNLIQCLIAMARSDTSGEIDADIQIALAVLLNSNEDYEKAQDCFKTALAVRPDDWLLYNRVGATMANSGRAEEALQYYHRALELNPLYIRARFNLGISCINLRRFNDAAHHILDALGLQESDGLASGMDSSIAITNNALWDSLRTASMHLNRPDLATFCDQRDLEGYRKNFRMA